MFEALQPLKSAYRNEHVSAAEDATKCVVAALDALDNSLHFVLDLHLNQARKICGWLKSEPVLNLD
jgi:hypothetical protein